MNVLVKGTQIFVDIESNTSSKKVCTLMLLHGGPGYDHQYFKPAFSRLSSKYMVVYLDHRGCGQSDHSTADHWTLDQWGDDVFQVVEKLGLEDIVLLGNSFGGYVAQNVGIRYGHRLAGIILSSTAARFRANWPETGFFDLYGPVAGQAAGEFWRDVCNAGAAEHFRRTCSHLYNTTNPTNMNLSVSTFNPDVLTHFYKPDGEGFKFDYRERLKSLNVPTLIIAGECDPVIPTSASRELADCIPTKYCEFHVIPKAGHGPHRDDENAVFELIENFISRILNKGAR